MGIFSQKKDKKKLVMILDVGSGSVGGAFVSLTRNKNGKNEPTILAQARSPMKYQNEIDFEKFSFHMNKAMHETVHTLMMKKIGRPKEVYCFLSSPWYVAETRKIHVEKKEKFFTSKKFIDDLVNKEISVVSGEYDKKYDSIHEKPKILESVILESLVNGYKVNDVFDKKVSTLDLIMYLSMSPSGVLDSIRKTIKKTFPHTDVFFGSFMMSFYNAIRSNHHERDSYLLIDINAEITDVGMVTDGLLTSFFSFPVGRNYVLRSLMIKKKITKEEAESLFRLYTSDSLEEDRKIEVKEILNSVEKTWKDVFYKSVVEISKISGYTDIVHLVSHNDSMVYFSNILENPNVPLAILGDRKFSVTKITGEGFKNLCKVKEGVCDEFLMSEAFCLASVYKL